MGNPFSSCAVIFLAILYAVLRRNDYTSFVMAVDRL